MEELGRGKDWPLIRYVWCGRSAKASRAIIVQSTLDKSLSHAEIEPANRVALG